MAEKDELGLYTCADKGEQLLDTIIIMTILGGFHADKKPVRYSDISCCFDH